VFALPFFYFMKFKKTEKVNGLPLELSLLKDHLRVTGDDEGRLIAQYANAAVDIVYHETWHLLKQFEYTFYLDDWEELKIPIYPIVSVDSVKYYNSSNVLTTLSSGDWYADLQECPGRVYFDNEPNLYDDRFNAIEVVVTAGYASHRDIPDGVLSLFLLVLTDLYENRQGVDRTAHHELPRGAAHLARLHSKQIIL
jgi:uncharacterized phiE125 gp8 family phage protein